MWGERNMINNLINSLSNVKKTGPHSWTASCPLHEDKHPSLVVSDKDGVILMHCFACHGDIHDLTSALDIQISDLFPDQDSYDPRKKQSRKYFPARDVLHAVASDIRFAKICSEHVVQGETLTERERKLLAYASRRLEVACEYCG